MKKKLRLYIWDDFNTDWSSGLAFAIATSEAEARKLVIEDIGYGPREWGDVQVKPLSRRIARSISGGE